LIVQDGNANHPKLFRIGCYVRRDHDSACHTEFVHKFNVSYSISSWLLSAYIIAAAFMTPIGVNTAMSPALPRIAEDFKISQILTSWIMAEIAEMVA
jgi:hypothetical protein